MTGSSLADAGFRIRRMTEDDLDQVVAIENVSFPNPWRRSFFASDIAKPESLCIVAESGDDRVVGYLIAWGWDEIHLANVAVAAEWRRQGIGRELMTAMIRWALERGASSIYLEVRESNLAAQRFYTGLGFVPTYRRKGYYENTEDAIVMERKLERFEPQQ
ncbi:MAG: ribosomal protein S18-alanine N-acetyltransferase [candidate division WOR-3 bacterium]